MMRALLALAIVHHAFSFPIQSDVQYRDCAAIERDRNGRCVPAERLPYLSRLLLNGHWWLKVDGSEWGAASVACAGVGNFNNTQYCQHLVVFEHTIREWLPARARQLAVHSTLTPPDPFIREAVPWSGVLVPPSRRNTHRAALSGELVTARLPLLLRQTKSGPMLLDTRDLVVQRSLDLLGEWEPHWTSAMLIFLEEGGTSCFAVFHGERSARE